MLLELLYGLPARKPGVDLVPKLDAFLAVFPAQVHLMVIMPRREIEQSGVNVLHLRAGRKHLVHQVIQPLEIVRDLAQGGVATIAG